MHGRAACPQPSRLPDCDCHFLTPQATEEQMKLEEEKMAAQLEQFRREKQAAMQKAMEDVEKERWPQPSLPWQCFWHRMATGYCPAVPRGLAEHQVEYQS